MILWLEKGFDWINIVTAHNHSTKPTRKAIERGGVWTLKVKVIRFQIQQNRKTKISASLWLYKVFDESKVYDVPDVPEAASNTISLGLPIKTFLCASVFKHPIILPSVCVHRTHIFWVVLSVHLHIVQSERKREEREMFDYYHQLAAGPSYQDSLKVLEADIQHANML